MPIGERVRIYRRRRGLSQPALVCAVGRSESWLSQVERGVRSIDKFSTILELARVPRVDVADLTGQPLSLAPNGEIQIGGLDDLRRVLVRYDVIPTLLTSGIAQQSAVTSIATLTRQTTMPISYMRQALFHHREDAVTPRDGS
jgi:transcriptional regulator with XRE-family HTH domain